MEELGASEAQKNEILSYEVLIFLKANDNFLYSNIAKNRRKSSLEKFVGKLRRKS